MNKVKLLKDIEAKYWKDLAGQHDSKTNHNYTIQALLNVRALLAQMDTHGLEDR